jgi:hypothetical protein
MRQPSAARFWIRNPQRTRASVRLTVTVLHTYLRFLVARDESRPEIV